MKDIFVSLTSIDKTQHYLVIHSTTSYTQQNASGSAVLSLTENTVRCLFWGMLNEFITKAGFRGGQTWNTRRRTVCPGLLWITHETTSLNNTSKIKGWTGMPLDSALSHSQKNSSLAHGYYSGLVPENSMCGHDLSLVWLSYACNTAPTPTQQGSQSLSAWK